MNIIKNNIANRNNRESIRTLLLCIIFGVLIQVSMAEVYDGYVFFALDKECLLYDNAKTKIHTWESTYRSAGRAHLLRDSSVLFCGTDPDAFKFEADGAGPALVAGRYQIITWDGEVVWDYKYVNKEYCPHHNSEIFYSPDDPDGMPHLLLICAVMTPDNKIMYDKIVEIKPTGKTTGEILWEWHSWDHITDSPNGKPGLFDENHRYKGRTKRMGEDWTHSNSISYNAELDQIVLGVKHFSEFIIIDHSTTTQEAKGNTGGKYGKGGDILYRWGCPENYGATGTKYIKDHHSSAWIPKYFPGTTKEVPGGGNVLFLHNTTGTAVSVKLPGNGDGFYPKEAGKPFEPSTPEWTAKSNVLKSPNEGSVQRLPNGNCFVADWYDGKLQEMNSNGSSQWDFSLSNGPMMGGPNQAHKYAKSYLGSSTSHIEKKKYLSKSTLPIEIYSNQSSENISISIKGINKTSQIYITSLNGREVFSGYTTNNKFTWSTKNMAVGIYMVIVKKSNTYTQYVNVIR